MYRGQTDAWRPLGNSSTRNRPPVPPPQSANAYQDPRPYNYGYVVPSYCQDAAPPRSHRGDPRTERIPAGNAGHSSCHTKPSRQDGGGAWGPVPPQNSSAERGQWEPMMPRKNIPPICPNRSDGYEHGPQRNPPPPPSRPRGSNSSSGSSAYSSCGPY